MNTLERGAVEAARAALLHAGVAPPDVGALLDSDYSSLLFRPGKRWGPGGRLQRAPELWGTTRSAASLLRRAAEKVDAVPDDEARVVQLARLAEEAGRAALAFLHVAVLGTARLEELCRLRFGDGPEGCGQEGSFLCTGQGRRLLEFRTTSLKVGHSLASSATPRHSCRPLPASASRLVFVCFGLLRPGWVAVVLGGTSEDARRLRAAPFSALSKLEQDLMTLCFPRAQVADGTSSQRAVAVAGSTLRRWVSGDVGSALGVPGLGVRVLRRMLSCFLVLSDPEGQQAVSRGSSGSAAWTAGAVLFGHSAQTHLVYLPSSVVGGDAACSVVVRSQQERCVRLWCSYLGRPRDV